MGRWVACVWWAGGWVWWLLVQIKPSGRISRRRGVRPPAQRSLLAAVRRKHGCCSRGPGSLRGSRRFQQLMAVHTQYPTYYGKVYSSVQQGIFSPLPPLRVNALHPKDHLARCDVPLHSTRSRRSRRSGGAVAEPAADRPPLPRRGGSLPLPPAATGCCQALRQSESRRALGCRCQPSPRAANKRAQLMSRACPRHH